MQPEGLRGKTEGRYFFTVLYCKYKYASNHRSHRPECIRDILSACADMKLRAGNLSDLTVEVNIGREQRLIAGNVHPALRFDPVDRRSGNQSAQFDLMLLMHNSDLLPFLRRTLIIDVFQLGAACKCVLPDNADMLRDRDIAQILTACKRTGRKSADRRRQNNIRDRKTTFHASTNEAH